MTLGWRSLQRKWSSFKQYSQKMDVYGQCFTPNFILRARKWITYVASWTWNAPFRGLKKLHPTFMPWGDVAHFFGTANVLALKRLGISLTNDQPTMHWWVFSLPPREGPSTVSWVAVMASKDFDGQFFGPRLFPTKIPGMLKIHREIYQVLYVKKQKTQFLFHPAILATQFTSRGSYVKHVWIHTSTTTAICVCVLKNMAGRAFFFGVYVSPWQKTYPPTWVCLGFSLPNSKICIGRWVMKGSCSSRKISVTANREHSQPHILRFVNASHKNMLQMNA